jgi:tetratricopeptide (TPR) repeat protein
VGATASERLFIGAVQKDIERSDQATAAWEAYLDLRPDDTRALDRLVIPWARAGRDDDIARAWMRAARLRPDDYMANHNAAWYGMVYGGRVKDVQPFVARAQALLSPEIDAQLAAWMRLEPVFADWLRGDAPAAARKLERAAARLELRDQAFLLTLASLNVGLGRLRAAEAAIGRLPVEAPKPWLPLAEIAWMRGDLAGARRAIVAAVNDPGSAGLGVNRLVALMVRVGMVEEAERFLAGQPEPIKSRSLAYPPAEGEVALARGDLDRALTGLAGWDKLARGIPARIVAGTSYAEALERQGDLATAARVLEALGGERAHLYQRPSSPIPSWVRSRARLARVYRALGRTGEGEVVQAEVRALLARADSDLAPPLRN